MAFDIKALRQRKADALKKASAVFEAAQTANRDLSKEERSEYDALMAGVKTLNEDIARAEALMDEERRQAGVSGSSFEVGDNRGEKKPYKSLGEQLSVIARGQKLIEHGRGHLADPRFQAALGTSETIPSDGGFMIEPEYSKELLEKIYETGEVASRIDEMAMESARLVIPAVDEDSRVDGQRWGGILSYWLAEGQPYTGTKPKFNERQLVANKLTALMYATEELLEDTTALKSYADRVVPDELGFQVDNSILQGTGAGQPLGIWNSPATIQQSIVAGETSISAQDILNMHSRAFAPYRKDAVWFINQALEPKLYPLTVGSPSLGQFLIYKPAGEGGNAQATMLGHPVIPIEQASAPGVVGDITLFCPQGYILARRNEVRADSSIHVAFLTGETAFRWMLRLDGQPWWKKPLQPYYPANGTAPPTQSAFITLGARSAD